jgi:lipoprotein-releasing system ATP-binding protein
LLVARDLVKEYPTAGGALRIVDNVSLSLAQGDAVAIVGPSGAGKSTLLYMLAALEPPSSGTVTLDGVDPYALGDEQQSAFRNKHVGFVFQDHCLLPQCTVLENVLVPTLVGEKNHGVVDRAKELLEQVGLSHRLEHRPSEMSGGEKQRCSIARALIREPRLLVADEPTGNLDRKTAHSIGDLLLEINRTRHNILIVVTHSQELAERFPTRYELVEGALVKK